MPIRARRPLRIAVLMGGRSSERAISLRSGQMIFDALKSAGYRVTALDPAKDVKRLVRDAKAYDIAFLALHGAGGEDGVIQGLLESIGLPYTGSGVMASALAMDKTRAKAIFAAQGVLTPRGAEVTAVDWKKRSKALVSGLLRELGKDLFVKPVSAGSSVATTMAGTASALATAIKAALKADPQGRCLIEQRVHGRELTVAVLGNAAPKALPVIEIRPKTAFFDLKAKYDAALCDELCPAPIPKSVAAQAQMLGLAAHRALGCRGYSRTDILWDTKKRQLFVLETNTLPGMTRESLLPKAAAAAGLDFAALLERMIALGLERP